MTERKTFTPGPWEVVYSQHGYIYGAAPIGIDAPHEMKKKGGVGHIIRKHGIGYPTSAEAQANATLIAAAPSLYEQLRQARGMLASCGFENPDDDPELVASWNAGLAAIDAALAKARGNQ